VVVVVAGIVVGTVDGGATCGTTVYDTVVGCGTYCRCTTGWRGGMMMVVVGGDDVRRVVTTEVGAGRVDDVATLDSLVAPTTTRSGEVASPRLIANAQRGTSTTTHAAMAQIRCTERR
jgi:hypothetical protein